MLNSKLPGIHVIILDFCTVPCLTCFVSWQVTAIVSCQRETRRSGASFELRKL